MRIRAHRPNRIGANPVAVKTHGLAPRPGRLTQRFPNPGRGNTQPLPNYVQRIGERRQRIYV